MRSKVDRGKGRCLSARCPRRRARRSRRAPSAVITTKAVTAHGGFGSPAEIEGACGVAFTGSIYFSDYYRRRVDIFRRR